MSSEVYYRSWMDKPHLDPNTNLLTEEYVQGIGEFMRLVQQQPDAKSGLNRLTYIFLMFCFHPTSRLTAFISTSEMYGGVKKRETVSVAELNTYVPESPSQFSIEIINGWCYSSCAKCPRKLQRRISSFTCTTWCNTSAVGVVRYRVAMLVVAREDSAVFVAFDASMTKLTNVMAVEVANPMNIVGKSYIFHLKLTELYSLLTIRPSLSPQSLTLIRESQGMSLHHNNPPEVVDETTLTAEAVQPTSNTDQLERIIGGNVDDPHGSPPGNPSKKAWNV
ncbi:hypothetical protein DY000_02039266 [Brassica cretica]|uniref:Replication factor A C-terminal domain-containing protein n=1 Tax=Brassica cretica TaxID=69181 RepID=A0ABQ7B4M1_BRACR|nr:hypothetical protein DY000_02039266 [Brassica cretica]